MAESSPAVIDPENHEWVRDVKVGDAGTVIRLRMPENVLLDVLREQDGYVWEVGYTSDTSVLIATDGFTTDLTCYQVKDEEFTTQHEFDDFFSDSSEQEEIESASFTRTAVDVRIDVRTEDTELSDVVDWLMATLEPYAAQRALYEF